MLLSCYGRGILRNKTSAKANNMANEPPAGDEGITDKPPSPKRPPRFRDSDDEPSIGRAPPSSSGWLIAIVAGVAGLGLCICGGVAVVFLGVVPGFFVLRQERVAAEAQAVAVEEVVKVQAAPKVQVGFVKGAEDAKDAVAKDHLLLKEYPPLPAPAWHGEYIKLLKERCKCDYQVIGEPNLAKERQDEIRGWNETMQAELRRRHGATIMEDLHKDAEKRWRDRIQPKENQ
jgi:hypothetical protein